MGSYGKVWSKKYWLPASLSGYQYPTFGKKITLVNTFLRQFCIWCKKILNLTWNTKEKRKVWTQVKCLPSDLSREKWAARPYPIYDIMCDNLVTRSSAKTNVVIFIVVLICIIIYYFEVIFHCQKYWGCLQLTRIFR